MLNNAHHSLIISRTDLNGREGWHFYCPSCGFHGFYSLQPEGGTREFEVYDRGNPHNRHFDETIREIFTSNLFAAAEDETAAYRLEEQDWLTPELRQQIEQITRGMDQDRNV